MKSNPFSQHLIDNLISLRRCLLWIIGSVFVIFIPLVFFANDLYRLLALPLLQSLPQAKGMIATNVTAPILVPLHFAFVCSIFLAIPIILFHIWKFIAPGLYSAERYWVWTILFFSNLLFYAGVAFAYFVVCPLFFNVIKKIATDMVQVMPDMTYYLNFMLKMLFAFGITFEVPIFMLLLVIIGISSVESLQAKRRYCIVLAFIIAMFLSPPDVLSQTLLAIPIWLLYELGLIFCRFLPTRYRKLIPQPITH